MCNYLFPPNTIALIFTAHKQSLDSTLRQLNITDSATKKPTSAHCTYRPLFSTKKQPILAIRFPQPNSTSNYDSYCHQKLAFDFIYFIGIKSTPTPTRTQPELALQTQKKTFFRVNYLAHPRLSFLIST